MGRFLTEEQCDNLKKWITENPEILNFSHKLLSFLVDVTETPIERPKKNSATTTPARKRDTLLRASL